MKWSFTLWALLLTLTFGTTTVSAQLSCAYTLQLEDDFGDGWNLASLIITVDGNPSTYTLDIGTSGTEIIPVTGGDDITIEYVPGGIFDYEVYYAIFDADGNLVFEDGTQGVFDEPQIGLVFEGTVVCPSCPSVLASSVDTENIRSSRADISWVPSDPIGEYYIEYDTTGFMPGTGLDKTVSGGATTLFNLEEKTFYDYYITALCANGDTSVTIGPYTFETLWAVDVGVSEVIMPETDCGLGANDTISLVISNFGGLPQTLIPINYSVNGIPGSVNMPTDGFFTGVVGTDSMEVTEFDATFDFSEPGEYILQVWTEMAGDSVLTNDTTTITIVSIPEIADYPYFDNFEPWFGGWTVESEGNGLPSWEYGTPAGVTISSAAGGNNAWVTNLDGEYNTNEVSYLVSPCFDFTSLDEDPRISFNINYDSEPCCDEGWVEVSTDGGDSWNKVGVSGSGVNWYNDAGNNWWDGNGGFEGWAYAQNLLVGTAGEPEVRIRFVMSTDLSINREGMGIDNVYITPVADDDLAATSLSNNAEQPCGSLEDQVLLTFTNVGDDPQVNYTVSYSVNGGPVVTETLQEVVLPGGSFTYTFESTFNSSEPGVYEITAWTDLDGDAFMLNDTITFSYRTANETPYSENFEDGNVPNGWLVDGNVFVDLAHNSVSQIMYANIYEFSPSTFMTTPVFGPIAAEDTLFFDYRHVDFFDGTIPTTFGPGDSMIVELLVNCNEENPQPIFTLTEENQVPSTALSTFIFPLAEYADSSISVRFRGLWGNGDYFMDIDNINIRSCDGDLGLVAEINGATSQTGMDGSISVTAEGSEGPFTYEWSNGDSTKVVSGLEPGTYKVTVTDRYGCQDVLEAVVDVTSTFEPSANIEQIRLAPNPTRNTSMLNVRFANPMDARIQLFNPVGQLIFETVDQKVKEGNYELDLSLHNSGLYLVRIIAEGEIQTAKLIKAR